MDNDEELPEILAQINDNWNIQNVQHIFDDLDLVDFDVDSDWDDDFYDDDDDFDAFDDYEDMDYEDSDEDRRKYVTGIFKTLEDSAQVLSKLTFHRESSKAFGSKLPRVLPGQTYTYECLHKVLEEIELLLKVWKKRVNHPFTAHLERKVAEEDLSEEPDSGFGSGLRIGQDYNESDVESDTTDLRHTFRSKTNVNLTLTRKKYCQSTKVYYNIFNSEFEFEQLQNQIKAMRKHVFNIAFNLFLQNVPTEKLPNELWEKIWKITLLEKEPDMSPTHSSGTREKIRKWTLFENERITDCFGAAGNIHMILFEILYKHAQIMLPPHLIEVDTVGKLTQMKYVRFYFFKFFKLLTRKFARLEVLDNGQFKNITLVDDPTVLTTSIKERLDKGMFNLSQVDMSHKHQVENRCALFVVFPKEPSTKYVAFVFEFQGNLRISICDVNTNEMVHSIQTDIPALEFHMEKGGSTNHGVLYRFSLSNKSFSVLLNTEVVGHEVVLCKWAWNNDRKTESSSSSSFASTYKSLIIDPEISTMAIEGSCSNYSQKIRQVNKSVVTTTIEDQQLVHFQFPNIESGNFDSTFVVGEDPKGQLRILRKIELPDPTIAFLSLTIRDNKKDKILFMQNFIGGAQDILLFNFMTNEILDSYKGTDLCELTDQDCDKKEDSNVDMEGVEQHSFFDCRFDVFKDQFIICKDYLSGYLIYSDEKKPRLLTKGNFSFVNLTFSPFRNGSHGSRILFMNGLLFGTYRLTREMMPLTSNYLQPQYEDDALLEIVAVDLESKSCQSLSTFGPSSQINSKFLLNETHRTIYSDKNPQLYAISDRVIGVMLDHSNYASINFGLSNNEIAEQEAEPMYKKQMEKEEVLKAKEAVKAHKLAIGNKYLNDPTLKIEGSIQLWKGSYGFMKAQGEAKALGNIFVHKSKITPLNSWIQIGQKVEAKLAKDQDHTNYMALEVKLLSDESDVMGNGQTGASRGNFRGRGSNRGGRFRSGRGSARGRGRGGSIR